MIKQPSLIVRFFAVRILKNNSGLESEIEKPFILLSKSEWQTLELNELRVLPERHLHHFFTVLRYREEFEAILTDGSGHWCRALARKSELLVESAPIREKPMQPEITVFSAPIKPQNMKWLVQKLVECGASSLRVFKTDYSNKALPDHGKLEKVAEGALMQSRSVFSMTIETMAERSIEAFENLKTNVFWGDLRHGENVDQALKTRNSQPVTFINGPEGGFSEREAEFLKKNFRGIKLSHNVLRSETAPVVFVSMLRALSL